MGEKEEEGRGRKGKAGNKRGSEMVVRERLEGGRGDGGEEKVKQEIKRAVRW